MQQEQSHVAVRSPMKLGNYYFFAAFLLILVAAAYGVFQYKIFSSENFAVQDNLLQVKKLEEIIKTNEAEYSRYAGAQAQKQEQFSKEIINILPADEDYSNLTRLLDDFFAKSDSAANPIFQSSLRFGKGKEVDGVDGVSALPFSMNIDSTRDNFYKFLEFVNASGMLESKTRLMDITNIQLNFAEDGEMVKNLKQKINFTVDMNAFYKTPKVQR